MQAILPFPLLLSAQKRTSLLDILVVVVAVADKRIASGGIVQLTKLDIQERDMARLKGKLQHSEKELAKYKDIEVKRR